MGLLRKIRGQWRRWLLNLFIAGHLLLLGFWGAPDAPINRRVTKPLVPYVLFTGLWHTWSMFAPSPYKLNYDLRARVKFKDGTERVWIAPRMEEMPWWKRIAKERHRKWRELMFTDSVPMAWKPAACFVARQLHANPRNPPVQVSLTRFWSPVEPPRPGCDFQPWPRAIIRDKSYTYAVCEISERDLR